MASSIGLNPAVSNPSFEKPALHGSLQGKEVTYIDQFYASMEEIGGFQTVAKFAITFFLTSVFLFLGELLLAVSGVIPLALPTTAALMKVAKGAGFCTGILGLGVLAIATIRTAHQVCFPSRNRICKFLISGDLNLKDYYRAKCKLNQAKLSSYEKMDLLSDAIKLDDAIAAKLIVQQTGIRYQGSNTLDKALLKGASLELIQVLVEAGATSATRWSSSASYAERHLPQDAKDRAKIIEFLKSAKV